MKKIIILVAMFTLVIAGTASAVILNSKHDLTSGSTGATVKATSTTLSACQFCHTPHLRNYTSVAGAPLWNRTLPTQTYTLYGGGTTLSGTAVAQPGQNSKTCLSCHDGTISVGDVLIGTDATIGAVANRVGADGKLINDAADPTTPDYNLGTNLSNEHPVGVVYNSATAGPGLNATVNASNQIGGKKWKIYGGGNGVGTVECGSCHDPHNTTDVPFLKDTKNTMCTDCHSLK